LSRVDRISQSSPRFGGPGRRWGVETLYRWRRAYGGMELPEVKRLKQLEQETTRLKKLLAERDLEVEVMKEIAAKKW
jgi:hypothetical protein